MTSIIAAITTLAVVTGLGAFTTRRRNTDDDTQWATSFLDTLHDTSGDTAELAPVPAVGLHRAHGEFAFEEVGTDTEYKPRHGLDPDDGAEIPPSMVPALELMTPLERARELVRQLNQARWHPWRHLPRLEAIRFVAATVAARNRVPLLLGQAVRPVLP